MDTLLSPDCMFAVHCYVVLQLPSTKLPVHKSVSAMSHATFISTYRVSSSTRWLILHPLISVSLSLRGARTQYFSVSLVVQLSERSDATNPPVIASLGHAVCAEFLIISRLHFSLLAVAAYLIIVFFHLRGHCLFD